MKKDKPISDFVTINWKLVWFAIAGLIIGAILLTLVFLNLPK